ncbi:uncharacterized protein LOC128862354 [Anastrepha ludens]|uniref:uncharacterized protein LOC128862354 n=1 Tax=Anastrepha ludens TaxID=28586 RepID=UPI0023B12B2A|nr:uncharacterized protein LOC128862354 [Anastrepha ludens]
MSLVSYAASSDDDSDDTNEEDFDSSTKIKEKAAPVTTTLSSKITNDTISDDEDDYAPTEFTEIPNPIKDSGIIKLLTHSLSLPKPKNTTDLKTPDEKLEVRPKFSKLPLPKHKVELNVVIEEDDEFLYKKAILPVEEVKPTKPLFVPPSKGPVKITVPSLKEFSDVDKDIAAKVKKPLLDEQKKSGLLAMLPRAKSEQNFSKAIATERPKPTTVSRLIPDTVKNQRPAHNTEGVDGMKKVIKKTNKTMGKSKPSLVDCSDSEESGDEADDFFSLNSEDKLPEVSMNEINTMVAERAAKMANAATPFLSKVAEHEPTDVEIQNERLLAENQQVVLDQTALQALAGSKAKRRRKEENIEVVDISSAEVLPSREEWMRTALASSTAYQPTGVLVDEEPVAGTRRKHQITYLAHKAKANEAELQAMWSANRQTRRATQSKYGF